MAQIPIGNLGNSVAQPGQVMRAPQGDQLGPAIERFGQIALNGQLANAAHETDLREQRQRASAALTLAKTTNDLHDAHDAVGRGVLDGSIPTENAGAEFQTRASKITEDNLTGYTPDQQQVMQAHVVGVTGTLGRSLAGVVEKRNQQDTAGFLDQYGEEQSRIAMREGVGPAVDRVTTMVKFAGPAANLNPKQQADFVQNFKEKTTYTFFDAAGTAAFTNMDLSAVRGVRAKVEGPEGEDIDPKQRIQLTHQLFGYERTILADHQAKNSEDRFDIVSRTKDVQSMVLSGVSPPEATAPTVDEYTKLYGGKGPAMWQKEVGNYLQVGGVLQAMRTATAAERDAMVTAAAPPAGEGFADGMHMREAVLQAKAVVEKQIADDPAAYALKTSPRVQRAQRIMAGVMADQNAPAEDKTAAMDFYARTTAAEQLRLGVDTVRDERSGNKPRTPQILTNAQANAIADQFSDQKGGGEKAAVLVASLEAQYGKWWPQVYGQLASENKLPPSALVIPNMSDPGARMRLATASVTKPDVFKEQMAPSDPADIRDKLLSEFSSARGSFSAQGMDGTRTLSTVMSETEKLAMAYRAQGKSIGAATAQAYTEVMGWKYEFSNTYRIPKTEQPIEVGMGASRILGGLNVDAIQPIAAPGLSPEKAKSLTLDAIKTNGQWITTGDESGLRLVVQGKDGAMYPVRKSDGSMFEMTWSDLRNQSLTEIGRQRRDERRKAREAGDVQR